MELRKKKNNNLSRVVNKLVKRGKLRVGKMCNKNKAKVTKVASGTSSGGEKRFVVDLNVNVNVNK